MKKTTKIATLLLAGLTITTLAACHSNAKTTKKIDTTVKSPEIKPAKPKELQDAPATTLTTVNGETLTLDQLKGQKVYMEVINTTVPSYTDQLEQLESLANDPALNFKVIALALPNQFGEQSQEAIAEWFNQQPHHNFTLHYGSEELVKAYNITSTPAAIYIDADGKLNLVAPTKTTRASNTEIISYMNSQVK